MKRLALIATFGLASVLAAAAAGASFDEIDISHLRGTQAEVAIAADPTNPNVLLAASNSLDFHTLSSLGDLMRTYTSTDGGATWVGAPGPVATKYGAHKRCNAGDPAPLIGPDGREYLAFLASQCITIDSLLESPGEFDIARLEVASRAGPASPWSVSQVYPVRSARFDDKPAIAIDASSTSPHFGRLYVAWTRLTPGKTKHSEPLALIVVSHSDDHGVTWTKPVVVPDSRTQETTFAGLAVDASGTLFVTWSDADRRVLLDRSTDGGDHFGADVVAVAATIPVLFCSQPGSFGLPAQAKRCLTPTPVLSVDSRPGATEHVYLTYSMPDAPDQAQDVGVSTFDATLSPIGTPHLVHPADSARDEFMPVSAVDDQGRLWVCYYDTGVDPTRKSTRFTCTASADGGVTFAAPRAVATVASNETKSPALPFQYGDYQGLAVAGGVAHPVWTDSRNLATAGEEIYTSTLTAADLQLP